jgi:hypothetical protein
MHSPESTVTIIKFQQTHLSISGIRGRARSVLHPRSSLSDANADNQILVFGIWGNITLILILSIRIYTTLTEQ